MAKRRKTTRRLRWSAGRLGWSAGRLGWSARVAALALVLPGVADAKIFSWECDITGAQIRNNPDNQPPAGDGSTPSAASGTCAMAYDTRTGILQYTIEWAGLEGDLLKLHLHGPAEDDESNINHLWDVFSTTQDILDAGVDRRTDAWESQIAFPANESDDCIDGTTPEQILPCMLAEVAYLNVHTEAYGGGEIRGNLVLPEPGYGAGCIGSLIALAALRTRRRASPARVNNAAAEADTGSGTKTANP